MNKIILLLLFFYPVYIYGQSNDTRAQAIVPLAPEMAELFKYTGMPVSHMTGIPDISYPLYEINTGKIRLPITLSYHASGIKVTQRATWTGLGWSLMPGGNISRAVRGIADETSTYGWFNHQAALDSIQYITNYDIMYSWVQGKPDGQPDFFTYSFPGKSGKFLYSRDDADFLTVPYQPVRIKRTTNSGTDVYQITDDDGTRYFYEDVQMCSVDNGGAIQTYPQSWLLSLIISNDGEDTVYLKYAASDVADPVKNTTVSTSCSKEFFNYETQGGTGAIYTPSEVVHSDSYSSVTPLELTEIVFRQGKVRFFAGGLREDYGGHTLDSVLVYSNEGGNYERVRKVSFEYDYFRSGRTPSDYSDYRLKLLSFSKSDIKGGQPETYRFGYNQTPLPNLYSYNVDYWGYYNGSSNTMLMPAILPAQKFLADFFGKLGTANRNPGESYITAGILNSITYPTGGFTKLEYETNKYSSAILEEVQVPVARGLDVQGQGRFTTVRDTTAFQVVSPTSGATHSAKINIYFSPFSPNPIDAPSLQVILQDMTTGMDLQIWSSDSYTDYQNSRTIQYENSFDVTHQYRVIASVTDLSTSRVTVSVTSMAYDSSTAIKPGPGVRVRRIVTCDIDSTIKGDERYVYGVGENGIGYMPLSADDVIHNNYYSQTLYTVKGDPIGCSIDIGGKYVYMSQNSNATVDFQGAPIVYSAVTKYQYGNNIPNGKTIYQYLVPGDHTSIPSPLSPGGFEVIDNSMYDVLPASEHVYRYDGGSKYTLLKETINQYSGHNSKSIKAITFWRNYVYTTGERCGGPWLNEFTSFPFTLKTGGFRLSKTIKTDYYDDGNTLTNTLNYTYNRYALPAVTTSLDSKNDTIRSVVYYPGDHLANAADAGVLDLMHSRNIIRQPYWQGRYHNNTLLSYTHTLFSEGWGENDSLIAAKADTLWQTGDGAPVSVTTYQAYNKQGHIQQFTDQRGITRSYTWNRDGAYPVSETINAPVGTVLFESFEDPYSISGITRDASRFHAGRFSGKVSGNTPVDLPEWRNVVLSSTTRFRYSGWYYTESGGAGVSLLMKRNGETGSYSYIDEVSGGVVGRWVYLEKEFDVPTDVTQLSVRLTGSGGGEVWFDDIKLRPSVSQMSTFTYQPLVGMTSKSDEGNHIAYYEYDGLGRLQLIRDKDRNITKVFCYNYTGTQENCNTTVYLNEEQEGSFSKSCTGGTGSAVIYKVDAGKYTSSVSVEDANQKAKQEILAKGQAYADSIGYCTYTNEEKTSAATKECPAGYLGTTETYIVLAGEYSSDISKEHAEQLAQQDIEDSTQINANNKGQCNVCNVLLSRKSDSGPLGTFNISLTNTTTGQVVLNKTFDDPTDAGLSSCVIVPAGVVYQVTISAMATLYATVNGTEKMITTSSPQTWSVGTTINCLLSTSPAPVYSNAVYTKSFRKDNCTLDSTGSLVSYTVPLGRYTSTISQAYVDSLAIADAEANGQTKANQTGFCWPDGKNLVVRGGPATIGAAYSITLKRASDNTTVLTLSYTVLDEGLPLYRTIADQTYIVEISAQSSFTASVNGTVKTVGTSTAQTWTTGPEMEIIVGVN